MQNTIYRSVIDDGETPTVMVATEEVNGFAVFLDGDGSSRYDNSTLIKWFSDGQREAAIEFAVDHSRLLRAGSKLKAI